MSPDYNLDAHYQISGHWWVPSDPRKKAKGTLYLKGREGAFLNLESSISPGAPQAFADHPVLLGVTHFGIEVTLSHCQQTHAGVFHPFSSEYRIRVVYIGRHFQTQRQIRLTAVYIWLHNADEWVNCSGFTLPRESNPDAIHIEYRRPQDIQLHSAVNTRLSIGFSVFGPNYDYIQKSLSLSQEAYLEISRARGRSLEDYLGTNRAIEAFLSLAIKGSVYPRKIKVACDNESSRLIEVFYAPVTRPVSTIRTPRNMVFSLRDVSSSIDSMVRRWLRSWPKLQPLCDLYLGDLYGKELYIENRFLDIAQVLESYHRRFIGGQYQDEAGYMQEVYPQLVAAIPEGLHPDYRQSLKGKMRFHFEYSLRKRLGDLIKKAPQPITTLLFGTNSQAKGLFVNRVVDTRNYFTHYTKELEPKSAKGEEIYWLYVKLRILSEAMFFRHMGLGLEQIGHFIIKNEEYQQELRLCREH